MQSVKKKKAEGIPKIDFGITLQELNALNEAKSADLLFKCGGVENLAGLLHTDLKAGLSSEEIQGEFEARRHVFGINTYPEPASKGFFRLFWDALQDTTLKILIVAGTVSLVLGIFFGDHESSTDICPHSSPDLDKEESKTPGIPGWVEGAAILVAVVLCASVTALNDYNKERQFRKLNSVKNNRKVKVIRETEKTQVSIYDINVGDVVILDTGDQVPADGIFIEGYNLETDESVMTGETDNVKKNQLTPFMLSGCQVVAGVGTMLVTAVGEHSEWGQTLSKLAEADEDETPLQEKLADTAKTIGNFGVGMAILTFLALMIKWGVAVAHCEGPFKAEWLIPIVNFFIMAVTIVVVAVPEGLPLAVTISLAYSMGKMVKDNVLVRHLEACETMGGATNICSDKTGTLTENRMTVVKMEALGKFFDVLPATAEFPKKFEELLFEGISVNSKAYITLHPTAQPEFVGNKTECALLMVLVKNGGNYEALRQQHQVRAMYAFSSEKKRMSTIIRTDGGFRLHTKGASETVLKLCTAVVESDGDIVTLTPERQAELLKRIDEMASSGLRTLCLGYRDFEHDNPDWDDNAPESDLTFLCIVGIKDPLRAAVPGAVSRCKKAGIFVRMVTGDNILTAKHIATECGILYDDGIALEGPVFRKMPLPELDKILPKLQVLARSSPSDKYHLVNRLRMLGEVVAVTGDGTNDAPALKEADVGCSMGLAGTEVAKEASDLILMDDNFESIVKAVMWGRSVFGNIRKFVQFQLTVNVVALFLAFIGAVTNGSRPLKPVQLLWVNLIMDTLGALALGTESPTMDLLNRKPYGRFERLVTTKMVRNIAGQAMYQLSVLLTLMYTGKQLLAPFLKPYYDPDKKYVEMYGSNLDEMIINSTIFNAFVLCQLFNSINSRRLENELNVFSGIFRNWIFIAITMLEVFCHIIIMTFLGILFEVVPPTWALWGIAVSIGSISLIIGFFLRLIPIPDWPEVTPPKVSDDDALLPDDHVDSAAAANSKPAAKGPPSTLEKTYYPTLQVETASDVDAESDGEIDKKAAGAGATSSSNQVSKPNGELS